MKRKRFSYITLGAMLSALLLFNLGLSAQVPGAMQYQGNIAVEGAPFDGEGQLKFAFLDSEGEVLWTNDGSEGPEPADAVSVDVSLGSFSVTLGSGDNPLTPEIFEEAGVVLRVWFNDGETGFEQLSPDQTVQSVAYAFRASGLTGDAAASLESAGQFQQMSLPVYTGQDTYVLPADGSINQDLVALYQANRAPFSVTHSGALPPDLAITNNTLGDDIDDEASGTFPITLIATNNAGTVEDNVSFIVDSFVFTDDDGEAGLQIDADPDGAAFDGSARELTTYANVGEALDSNVRYRWFKGGSQFAETTTPTVMTPAFEMGSAASGTADYSVKAIFDLGTTIDGAATGVLDYNRGFNITGQPAAADTVVAGDEHTATIAVTLESGYSQTVSRQWQQSVSGNWVNISGQTGNTLTVASITDTNPSGNTTRSYRARVSSPYANTTSATNAVTVEPDFTLDTDLTGDVTVLASRAAALFVVASLRAEAQDDAALSYSWYSREDADDDFTGISGADESEILWAQVHEDQAGQYKVRVNTQYSVLDSSTSTLTVNPDFTVEASEGDDVEYQSSPVETEAATLSYDVVLLGANSLYTESDGSPNPTRQPVITWYRQLGDDPDPSSDTVITTQAPYSTATTVHESANTYNASGEVDAGGDTRFLFRSQLTVDPATPTRAGDYYVTVDTAFINPKTADPVTLTVTVVEPD